MNESEINKKYEWWLWREVISEDQIKEINSICEKYYESDFYDNPADTVKNVKVKGIRWEYLKPILYDVMETWLRTNADIFGYSLFPVLKRDLFTLNIYDSSNNGEYAWHLDGSSSHIYDVKLTGILNISDEPYEGGEFGMFSGEFKNIPNFREPGSLLLLGHRVLHNVEPVTKGIRKTLSYWFTGPKFI